MNKILFIILFFTSFNLEAQTQNAYNFVEGFEYSLKENLPNIQCSLKNNTMNLIYDSYDYALMISSVTGMNSKELLEIINNSDSTFVDMCIDSFKDSLSTYTKQKFHKYNITKVHICMQTSNGNVVSYGYVYI